MNDDGRNMESFRSVFKNDLNGNLHNTEKRKCQACRGSKVQGVAAHEFQTVISCHPIGVYPNGMNKNVWQYCQATQNAEPLNPKS